MPGSDIYKRKLNEAKMLFTPTLETNDNKSHELAEELVQFPIRTFF